MSLENQLADETRHQEELERILAGWGEFDRNCSHNEDRWEDDGGPA